MSFLPKARSHSLLTYTAQIFIDHVWRRHALHVRHKRKLITFTFPLKQTQSQQQFLSISYLFLSIALPPDKPKSVQQLLLSSKLMTSTTLLLVQHTFFSLPSCTYAQSSFVANHTKIKQSTYQPSHHKQGTRILVRHTFLIYTRPVSYAIYKRRQPSPSGWANQHSSSRCSGDTAALAPSSSSDTYCSDKHTPSRTAIPTTFYALLVSQYRCVDCSLECLALRSPRTMQCAAHILFGLMHPVR